MNIFDKRHKYTVTRNAVIHGQSSEQFMQIWHDGIQMKKATWKTVSGAAVTKLSTFRMVSFGSSYYFRTAGIASGYATEHFDGEISAIRIYNRVLSKEEIEANYLYDQNVFGL